MISTQDTVIGVELCEELFTPNRSVERRSFVLLSTSTQTYTCLPFRSAHTLLWVSMVSRSLQTLARAITSSESFTDASS